MKTSDKKPGNGKARMSEDMYRQRIIELYKNPMNFGKLSNPTFSKKMVNSLCGDEMNLSIKVIDGYITDARFEGKGCAISMASASLITEMVRGMKPEKVLSLTREDVVDALNIPVSAARIKCALLPLETIKQALGGENGTDKDN